jgi:hypothetical protein
MKRNLPNPFGRTLGLVHGDRHGNHSDTPTGKDTTHDEERDSSSSGLQGDTNCEDADSKDDTVSPTEEVGSGSGEKSTKEGSSG